MPLTPEEVRRIAELARIGISDAESLLLWRKGQKKLALIGRMQKVDTEGIAPMTHAQGLALRLRPDKVTESDQRELFLSLAPQKEAGLYLVPKVIE